MKNVFYLIKLIILIITIHLISGCSQVATTKSNKVEIQKPEYYKIANDYLNKSYAASTEYEQEEYKLNAIENFILAEDLNKATTLINNFHPINHNFELYAHILKAQIALHDNQVEPAQHYLQSIWSPKQLSEELQIKFYQTRSNLYSRINNPINAVKDNISLEELLKNPSEKLYKNKEIWSILRKLTPNDLQELQQNSYNNSFNGWLNFTYIMKQYDADPDQLDRSIAIWRISYPEHPANSLLLEKEDAFLEKQSMHITPPKHIALLLPMQGPYAQSAEIIRDGFLAAYYEYSKNNANNTEIRIYDTATSKGVNQAYKHAITEQSDFIVGPLIKKDIETISHVSDKHIPILALNTTNFRKLRDNCNLFQFSLSPEEDVTELTEQIVNDGHKKILLIVSTGEWGQRVASEFKSQLEEQDAEILSIEKISANEDVNSRIRKILNIDDSEQRIRKLKSTGIKFNSKATRRQDIDAIIIATNPALARQIKPLLNFYYANNIPTYGHSAIYTGKQTPMQDQDLNNIIFCDLPWLLDPSITSKSIYKSILQLWPNKLNQSPRLYAFGIDAYKIVNQLGKLKKLPHFGISGMTGMLTLDSKNKIQRKLMWAKFLNGKPTLLSKQL